MRFKDGKKSKKFRRSGGSLILYAAAVAVALIGLAYLATNILLFQKTVAQYVAQGYPVTTVTDQLIPSQLLPGIYEPVGVYGGIAFILLGAAMINQKVCNLQTLNGSAEADAEASVPGGLEHDDPGQETLEPNTIESNEIEQIKLETAEHDSENSQP